MGWVGVGGGVEEGVVVGGVGEGEEGWVVSGVDDLWW